MGWGFSPLDEELSLGPGAFSPYLVEGIVRLGVEIPFERVPEVLSFFTQVGIGEETARALTERAGAALVEIETAEVEELEREGRASVAGPAVQQLSVDGAMVPLTQGEWAEVKTLAIGTVEVDVGGEAHARDLSYFSRLADAQTFCRLAQGERRGTRTAGKVCAVLDGAEWLQKFVDWHCRRAVRILDLPHAAEHLSAAAQAVFGQGTPAVSEWLGTWLHELGHGDPDRVLAALRTLPVGAAPDPEAAGKTRDEVLAYLKKRRAQICYAEFVAAGYPIGSGMVESANKLVVEARLKGSGMHWKRANVNPMLALRTAVCSGGRWEQVWPEVWRRLRRRHNGRVCRCGALTASTLAGRTVPPHQPAQPARSGRLTWGKRPPKGLMVNGRPTPNHPWKRAPLSRPQPESNAKL